ncbi:MAG: hypothetical protein JRI55_36995 [Deltaproteobacteria bacterium]|nr:hypothetical protein [Deltaproteobacteria bacterium]
MGYIYVYAWIDDAGTAFRSAVEDLWSTDGLIVDFRFNLGGDMSAAYETYSLLFAEDISGVFAVGTRASQIDYYALDVLTDPYDVTVDSSTYYDHPIAVLTGPGAISSGDVVAYYLAQHPRARRFGLPTNGSACFEASSSVLWDPDPYVNDLTAIRTTCVGLDANGEPLALGAVDPEEQVWLTPQDVAAGRDTVVEAALEWVLSDGAS